MTLLELCEPMFQYIGVLTRSGERGAQLEIEKVRREIRGIFADMRMKAEANPHLAYQYDHKIYLAIVFYVDFMIKESNINIASSWEEMAYEENALAGDEQFFDLLDETLMQNTEVSLQQLLVFRECLRLGFTGCYSDDWRYLRQKHTEIETKFNDSSLELSSRITPAAYEHAEEKPLRLRPLRSFFFLRVTLVALLLLVFGTNFVLYYRSAGVLRDKLHNITTITDGQIERQISSAPPKQE